MIRPFPSVRRWSLAVLLCLLQCWAAVLAVAAPVPWPERGRVVFDLSWGGNALVVGRATFSWLLEDGNYQMSSYMETTGTAALLKKFTHEMSSSGSLGPDRPQPSQFRVEQSGRKAEQATLDWKAGEVRIQRRDTLKRAPLHSGDQDLLSLWLRLAWPVKGVESLQLVSNKSATAVTLESRGEEDLDLPLGKLRASHYRAASADGSLQLDVWVDPARQRLPVRVRMQDGKGQVFDLRARDVRLQPLRGVATLPLPAA